jgi:hypothetical protein
MTWTPDGAALLLSLDATRWKNNGLLALDVSSGAFTAMWGATNDAFITHGGIIFATAGSPDWSVSSANGLTEKSISYVRALIKDGSVYRLWYDDRYATSTDGTSWVTSPTVIPIFLSNVLWNSNQLRYETLALSGDGMTWMLATRP